MNFMVFFIIFDLCRICKKKVDQNWPRPFCPRRALFLDPFLTKNEKHQNNEWYHFFTNLGPLNLIMSLFQWFEVKFNPYWCGCFGIIDVLAQSMYRWSWYLRSLMFHYQCFDALKVSVLFGNIKFAQILIQDRFTRRCKRNSTSNN